MLCLGLDTVLFIVQLRKMTWASRLPEIAMSAFY
jgi:hypothetical protein